MTARITKVKIGKDRIIVETIETGIAVEKEATIKSAEEPHPDLMVAFLAIEQHTRKILEWPDSYAKGRVRITGASWSCSETTGVEGATIIGQVALEECDAPFSFCTPHLKFDQDSDTAAAKLMPVEAQLALENLRTEVEEFIGGKRRQGALDLPTTEVAAAAHERADRKAKKPAGKMAAAGADA